MALLQNQSRVLIIGGGNCGLAIATGLKKAAIPFTVFERSTKNDFESGTRNWGMVLHWAAEYFEKLLPAHLLERIRETQADPSLEYGPPSPFFNAETGVIFKEIETPNIRRVSRRKIRNFLTEGENLDIQFDKKLKRISVEGDNVEAEFEDGTKEIGTIVVGCDGSHSRVREFLVGKEAAAVEDTGQTMINYAAEGYTPDQARFLRSYHPITQLAFNHSKLPGAALLGVLDIPDPEDTTDWKFVKPITRVLKVKYMLTHRGRFQIWTGWSGPPSAQDLEDPVTRMSFVRERMAQFCEPFRTGFLAVPDDKVMPVFPGHQWAPRMKWNNYGGKVTIAGDAAHPVLPHRGQGLNNAIKDASDIVDAIIAAVAGTQSLADGISAYEEEMRARGTKEVELSYQQMLMTERKDLADSPLFKAGFRRNDEIAPSTDENHPGAATES